MVKAGVPEKERNAFRGRDSVQYKRGHATAKSTSELDGAETKRGRHLTSLLHKIMEIKRQVPNGLRMGAPSIVVERTWANAQDLNRRMGRNELAPRVPNLLQLEALAAEVKRELEQHQRQTQGNRVRAWKEKLRNDMCQTRRHTFAWLRNEPFSSVTLLKKEDGTYTGNLAEIDAMVRKAWEPIMEKYKHAKEPDWKKFEERFGKYIPKSSPLELGPLTGRHLEAAAKKQKWLTTMGADGWRSEEFKKLPSWLFDDLAVVLNMVESEGVWPSALEEAAWSLHTERSRAVRSAGLETID